MPLFNFFKKKKKTTTYPPSLRPSPPTSKRKKEAEKKKEVKKVEKKEKLKEKVGPVAPVKLEKPIAKARKREKQEIKVPPFILKEPHISEKATTLSKENQYIFKVYPKANKTEIKKAIESLYGVDVLSINLIKIPQKRRRLGRSRGFKKGYKKALIKIKKGQKIEIL